MKSDMSNKVKKVKNYYVKIKLSTTKGKSSRLSLKVEKIFGFENRDPDQVGSFRARLTI